MMKKILVVIAAVAAMLSFASCKPEEKPEPEKNLVDHFEFRSTLNYSQDVLDNFDLVYDIVSEGSSIASGTMSGDLKPIEVKSGIKEGKFEVHFDFQAKSSFYSTFEIWKDYVVSIDTFIGLYSVFKDGSEQELISEHITFKDGTFGTFVEEHIPDVIGLMEDALALDETFTIMKDENGQYIAWI